ncbi:MAG: dipicolinate synthase subunit B [Clostridia bacterium]|nr:dipicolinate synthase subunit B [Clostridia bacterium]
MIGYAICGPFCSFSKTLVALEGLISEGCEVQPIMSERAYSTDTRFYRAEDFRKRLREITGREIIHTVEAAEPLGPRAPLDSLIISPCTGNTLAKIARGITDSAVTMAAKAHLRSDRPLLIALASNDAMSQNLSNIARLITRRSTYFVPMLQDDPKGKPHSLVADFDRLSESLSAMREGRQLRPIFLEPREK